MASSVHIGSDGLGPGGDRLLIVHDQAADLGGHERALEALLGHYPAANAMAPHFTPTNRPEGHRTAWDGRSRLVGRGGRRSSFLAPVYARRLAGTGVQDADVVLSITQGGWSLAARVAPGAIHLCYSGGLPGHLYGQSRLYLGHEPRPLRPLIAVALPGLRAHDRRMMRRPRRVIANSAFSASELRRIHGRDAEVVHPPVRTDFFTPGDAPRQLFLVVARLIASKRVDLVVEAFRGLEEELVVAGGGPMLEELRRAAPRNVRFVGPCDDETLRDLYRRSRALICPSLETFGIAMTEAHACGVPVIAPRAGGALEVVSDRRTGILLDHVTPGSVAEAVRALGDVPLDARACRSSAERFAEARFTSAMDRILHEELARQRSPR